METDQKVQHLVKARQEAERIKIEKSAAVKRRELGVQQEQEQTEKGLESIGKLFG